MPLTLLAAALISGGVLFWQYLTPTPALSPPTDSSRSVTLASTKDNSKGYLVIKEWGVRAPYSGSNEFRYKINSESPNTAVFTTEKLARKYYCTDFGAGKIIRFIGSEDPTPDHLGNTTVTQDATANPGKYAKVGAYYYIYVHDQASCSDIATISVQNAASEELRAIVLQLQPAP